MRKSLGSTNVVSLNAQRQCRAARDVRAIDTAIRRLNLRQATMLVRRTFPSVKIRDAWTYHYGAGNWEFHGPDGYVWYGQADGAYDARYQGWTAWFEKKVTTPNGSTERGKG